MLIFEFQNDTIKLAVNLSGNALSETPERYLYFMNYWEYRTLITQIKRLNSNPDAIIENQLYKMVASSFVVSGPKYVLYCMMDTPYCLMWITTMPHQRIIDVIGTTIELTGRLLNGNLQNKES